MEKNMVNKQYSLIGSAKHAMIILLLMGLAALAQPAQAQVVLNFEGVGDQDLVLQYYNGGLTGLGAGPGNNYGVYFSSNARGVISQLVGGSGNIAGLPSPVTAVYFNNGTEIVMSVPAGFEDGFSTFYSAPFMAAQVQVYDGVEGTGNLIVEIELPTTPEGSDETPFSPFVPIGVAFTGTARSVVFVGSANQAVYDNITLGSDIPVSNRIEGDYNGNGVSDLAVYDTGNGNWYIRSPNGSVAVWASQWGGFPGAITVAGDYNGDGRADMAIYNADTGIWYIRDINGTVILWNVQWGGFPGAIPVSGDFNGDGRSDLAIYDHNGGVWYIRSVDGTQIAWAAQWGGFPGAIPVSGDFNGDGRSDLGIYDQNGGVWYIRSIDGTIIAWAAQWGGFPGAMPVVADYNGDGLSDLAIYDQNGGVWYIRSINGTIIAWASQWGGFPGALPVVGDYNGDGISDLAIYNGNAGTWYVREVTGSILLWESQWGYNGALPVSSAAK